MFGIAQQIEALLEHDPELVRDVYIAAFGYRETSDSTTSMGGIVLQLTSTRSQDYNLALFGLKEAYPTFLEKAPEPAVVALNAALEVHFARERSRGRANEELTFDFQGFTARFLADHSGAWDRGGGRDDEVIEMLGQFQSRLDQLAQKPGAEDELSLLIRGITRECRLAAIWRRLLEGGTRHPTAIGLYFRELAWTPAVLTSHETSYTAGDFIRAILPHLSAEERTRVEEAVLAIPGQRPAEEREWAEHDRDRLLGCIADLEPLTGRGSASASCRLQTRCPRMWMRGFPSPGALGGTTRTALPDGMRRTSGSGTTRSPCERLLRSSRVGLQLRTLSEGSSRSSKIFVVRSRSRSWTAPIQRISPTRGISSRMHAPSLRG